MNKAVEENIQHCRSYQLLVGNNYKSKSIKHQCCDQSSCAPFNNADKFSSNSGFPAIFKLVGHYDVEMLPLVLLKKLFLFVLSLMINKLLLLYCLNYCLSELLQTLQLTLCCLYAILKEYICEELEYVSNDELLQDINSSKATTVFDREQESSKHVNSHNEVCTERTMQLASLLGIRNNHGGLTQSELKITALKNSNLFYSCNTNRLPVAKDVVHVFRAQSGKNAKQEVNKSLLKNEPANFVQECYRNYPSTDSTTNKFIDEKRQSGAGASGTAYKLLSLSSTLHQQCNKDGGNPEIKPERRKALIDNHAKDTKSSLHQPHTFEQPPVNNSMTSNTNKPQRSFPRRACVVYKNEQYSLDPKLFSLPRATKYLVKVKTEISPGRFMAKLELHCASEDEKLPNLDVTATTSSEQVVPVRERKHFHFNINKTGYVIFSSDLESFSGHIQYPLPNKRATASRIGYGGNAIVFVVFHAGKEFAGKEFAVKKTVYRSKEISVHSQLCHPNIINLEAVLVGEKHERHRDKYYVYCFMQKMDINFRNVLSTKDHGCLKHLKMKLVEKRDQWETVLLNVKHVLRSVLKALDYMHGQGLVHRDVKARNILIKTTCQCSEVLYCSCQHKFIVQLGDFDSSATVPGYQLHLEEHQMIRYASVLPLGTMGYRAPEVSMHLVLSGPYEVLYTTGVDIWSFGCLLLAIFIGKSGPLKQRGEASLLLSAQDYPYSQELYHKVIKINEVQKYYTNVSGLCDLVEKCLQVQPHCRPTAKELLQLHFFR